MIRETIKGKVVEISDDYLPNETEDYMNESHLAYFQYQLKKILDESRKIDSSGFNIDYNFHSSDEIDSASVQEEILNESRIKDRHYLLTQKILRSLRRIQNGTYGYCTETGDPIGLRRLIARPTTDHCVEVQTMMEKEKEMREKFAKNISSIDEVDDIDH